MRVTNQMIVSRTIFNLSRNADRFMHLQSMLSTGRRINIPSDDPIGTQRDLNYRTRLAEISQYKENISQATGRLSFYEDAMHDLKNLYESANLTATTMSNDTYTGIEREAAANEIESLYQQVLQLGNKTINGRYIFSGHRIRTSPLEASTNGVVFRGDTGALESEIESGARIRTNLNGQGVFFKQLTTLGESSDLSVGLTSDTNLEDLNSGTGVELIPGTFEVYDANQDVTFLIDLSSETTVGGVIANINASLASVNLSIDISGSGNSLAWRPTIGTLNSITDSTPVSNLNEGKGLQQDPGIFRIRNADSSISFNVDVSTASNLGEVRDSIEAAIAGAGLSNIAIGYNANRTGLSITDSNGTPLGLIVEDIDNTQTTVADLGLGGNVGAYLDGADLRPKPDITVRDIGAQTVGNDLGILGNIRNNFVGQDVKPQLILDSNVASLNNNISFSLGVIEICQGNRTSQIDLGASSIETISDIIDAVNNCGLDVTASINEAGTGIQIVSDSVNESLIIKNGDSTDSAKALGIFGSPDMLGSLILLAESLHNNDREMIGELMDNLGLAMAELLRARAEVGSRLMQLETTQSRLESSEISVTKMLSEVEDADIISLVSDVAREENLYKAALIATSKIIQPSLMDFLR